MCGPAVTGSYHSWELKKKRQWGLTEDCTLHVTLIIVGDEDKSGVYPSKVILGAAFYVKLDRHYNRTSAQRPTVYLIEIIIIITLKWLAQRPCVKLETVIQLRYAL